MLFSEVAAASQEVAATRSRKAKISAIADLLRRSEPEEVPAVVGFLSGEARQGRIGVGYAAAFRLGVSPAADPSLTIEEVDEVFAQIPLVVGSGSQAARSTLLSQLFSRATADEQDFLRRLLVGEVRQGALEGVVVEAVAQAADLPAASIRRALLVRPDLGLVAKTALAGSEPSLTALTLQVLNPVKPMLAASGASLEQVVAGSSLVEWKLDGARIQVHRLGEEVRVFTRNLNDITGRVPEVVKDALALPIESVVLDGEAMGLRPDNTPQPFQETMSRFGTEAAAEGLLHPFFFDCLWIDGEPMIDRPLVERQAALDRVVPEERRIPRITTADLDEATAFMEAALTAGHEGVMVKAVDSLYEAGRRGGSWKKVKPAHTYDLVVLAAEWGHGRRTGFLSNIHLGARDPETGEFVMVGKTFKGMTDEMLRWQTERFQELEVSRTNWGVEVRPEQMVEVALDGVQASPRYPGGIALRFARVKRYRDDKDPSEADTIDTLRALLR
jgi:DNA ligase-1